MDYYILHINYGLSVTEELLHKTYINKLLFPSDAFAKYSEYFVPFSSHVSRVYIAVLNSDSTHDKILEWKETNAENIYQISFQASQSNAEKSSLDIGCIFSEQIYALADQLPMHDTCILDVIINGETFSQLPINKNAEFASSLYRLLKWHGAYFAIISSGKADDCSFTDWKELLMADMIHDGVEKNLGPVLWRGSTQFQYSNLSSRCSGFELRFGVSCHNTNVKDKTIKINSSNKNSKAALIMKLHHILLDDKPKLSRSFVTSKWKKMISLGLIKIPECDLPNFDEYTTLAVTYDFATDYLIAYPLLEPSFLNSHCYFNMVCCINKSPQKKVSCTSKNMNAEEIKLPVLSQREFLNIMNEGKLDIKGNILSEYKNILSFLDQTENCLIPLNESSVHVVYDELDPCDWPERVCLLQKQMQIDEQASLHAKSLTNLSLRQPGHNADLTCKDILKHFQQSGEAKDLSKAEAIELINKTQLAKTEFSNVIATEWPKVLNCSYDDIYYNSSNKAEEKEQIGNTMANLYIKFETSSSCSMQQHCPSFNTISLYMTPTKVWRNLVSKKVNLSLKKNTVKKFEKKSGEIKVGDSKGKQRNDKERLRKSQNPVKCSPRKNLVNYASVSNTRRSLNFSKSQKDSQNLTEVLKKKLRAAVATALEGHGIDLNNEFFRSCGKKLFAICQTFLQDIPKTGSVSQHMQKIADAHVKQVIEFEKQKRL